VRQHDGPAGPTDRKGRVEPVEELRHRLLRIVVERAFDDLHAARRKFLREAVENSRQILTVWASCGDESESYDLAFVLGKRHRRRTLSQDRQRRRWPGRFAGRQYHRGNENCQTRAHRHLLYYKFSVAQWRLLNRSSGTRICKRSSATTGSAANRRHA